MTKQIAHVSDAVVRQPKGQSQRSRAFDVNDRKPRLLRHHRRHGVVDAGNDQKTRRGDDLAQLCRSAHCLRPPDGSVPTDQ
jgi:hypothetical protein